VVSGIGFLGAGVIFKEGVSVRGLNTAATLWCSAAIGTLAGGGFLVPAVIGTVAILFANMLLRPLAQQLNRQSESSVETEVLYRMRITCREPDEKHIRKLVLQTATSQHMLLRGLFSRDLKQDDRVEVWADLITTGRHDAQMEQVLTHLGLEDGVTAISWEIAASHDEEPSSS
jgi:putative Mg2+ transporter-C (MgtC) family protein